MTTMNDAHTKTVRHRMLNANRHSRPKGCGSLFARGVVMSVGMVLSAPAAGRQLPRVTNNQTILPHTRTKAATTAPARRRRREGIARALHRGRTSAKK